MPAFAAITKWAGMTERSRNKNKSMDNKKISMYGEKE